MDGPAAVCTARPQIWLVESIAAMTAVCLNRAFQNFSIDLQSLQGTDSSRDRRQLFVSLDRIDRRLGTCHIRTALLSSKPATVRYGAGSQTCASTALVRRVYLTEMCQQMTVGT